jgi:hypothetical protein
MNYPLNNHLVSADTLPNAGILAQEM